MATTYEPIATTTVSGSSTGTVTFSSISSAYTDLYIVCTLGLASGQRLYLRFNGITANEYSDTWLTGEGANVYSGRDASQAAMTVGGAWNGISTTLAATATMQVMSYANTSTFKTVLSALANDKNGSGSVDRVVGLWSNTSAINSVSVVGGANFVSGSTITLYGILKA